MPRRPASVTQADPLASAKDRDNALLKHRPLSMDDAAGSLDVSRRWFQDFIRTVEPCWLLAGNRKLFDEKAMTGIRAEIFKRGIKIPKPRQAYPKKIRHLASIRSPSEHDLHSQRSLVAHREMVVQGLHPTSLYVKRFDPNQALWAKHPSIVYFIRCGEFVKIGTTDKLDQRFASLHSSTPHDLRICLTFPGGRNQEKKLHTQFKEYWHRFEWFRLSDEIQDFIRKNGGTVGQ